MEYLITFLEGIITFISPCLLPMLPIYLSYFSGSDNLSTSKSSAKNALGFIVGFTIAFVSLGAFAGILGSWLLQYQTLLHIISGGIVILFGLSFCGIFSLPFAKGIRGDFEKRRFGFVSAMLFGLVFAISWTPCIGTFLGSALLLASQQASALQGILLLLCYSAGLGIPFLLSALLLHTLQTTFQWIKNHYKLIQIVSGVFLILIGILMATGFLSLWLTALQ